MAEKVKTRAVVALLALALMLVPLYSAVHLILGPAVQVHPGFELPLYAEVLAMGLIASLALVSLLLALAPHAAVSRALRFHISHGFYLSLPFDHVVLRLAGNRVHSARARKTVRSDSVILGEKS